MSRIAVYKMSESGEATDGHYISELGDKIPECPEGHFVIEDGVVPEPEDISVYHEQKWLDVLAQRDINQASLQFLASTDWKVIRHRDQLANGDSLSMTATTYKSLLAERQAQRALVIEEK